jgi:hypothetical protein
MLFWHYFLAWQYDEDIYLLPAYLFLQMAALLNSYSIGLLSKHLTNFSEITVT